MNKILLCLSILIMSLVNPIQAEIQIEFYGNQSYSDNSLLTQLDLPKNLDTLKEQQRLNYLNLAKYNLEVLYENEGYFNYNIQLDPLEDEPDHYRYNITEGNRFRYESITIVDKSKSLEVDYPIDFEISLKSKTGQFYNGELLSEDLDEIIYQFKERGYLQVQMFQSLVLDETNSTISVTFEAFPGPRVKFNKLEIITKRKRVRGQENRVGMTSHQYLIDLWDIPKDSIIPGEYWDNFRKSLLNTGVYSSVNMKAKPIETLDTMRNEVDTSFNVELNLVERTPGSYNGNIFYEQLLGFGLGASAKHKNIGGGLNEISLGGILAQNRYQVSTGYGHPFILKTPYRFDTQVTLRRDSIPDPTEVEGVDYRSEIINKTTVSRKFNEYLRLLTLGDLRRVEKLYTGETKVKFKLEPSIQLQFTDRLTNPTLGSKFRLAVGNGGPFSMDNRYFYSKVESDYYLPLGNRLFWAASADWGKFFNTGDRDDAKLFYLGGFRSIRGYDARSVAPSKDTSYVVRGDTITTTTGPSPQFLRLSNEFRYNTTFLEGLQLVQFTDWGKIIDLDPDYKKAQEMGVGLGLRYQISLLTLRLDYTLKKRFFEPFAMEEWEFDRISFDLSQAI